MLTEYSKKKQKTNTILLSITLCVKLEESLDKCQSKYTSNNLYLYVLRQFINQINTHFS